MFYHSQKPRKVVRAILRLAPVFFISIAGLLMLFHQISRFQALSAAAAPAASAEYDARKSGLSSQAQQPFVDDPLRTVESPLDRAPFTEINKLACPKPVDNAGGWSIEARTGGRPFMNFDNIEIDGVPYDFTAAPCATGTSTITQQMLSEHYNTYGKSVNRFWFIHPASNGYPVVLAMTPDGFFNANGATGSTKQGAAARVGFIGEPFSATMDYLQHVDEVSVFTVDDDTLLIVANVHSEAGAGVLELELTWDDVQERPVLRLRSAHVTRTSLPQSVNRLGFAGFNFMRGPTLSGLLNQSGAPEGGIEAFHDGRSVFLVRPDGSSERSLLVPPVLTTTVVREDIATQVVTGSKLILDQPQDVQNYFSKFPGTPYETRTDLLLSLDETPQPVLVRRAQEAVDLTAVNPEANETTNVFYATDMISGTLYEFAYTLRVEAADFEQQFQAREHGLVFVSDRSENRLKLFFLPLDANYLPAGAPFPLTDGVITAPLAPDASDGRFILFDADDYGVGTLPPAPAPPRRVYLLDLTSGAVQRRTVDPVNTAGLTTTNDFAATLNPGATLFAMTTDRQSVQPTDPTYLNIESVSSGLGSGNGNGITQARSADWSLTRNELVLAATDIGRLQLYDVATQVYTTVVNDPGNMLNLSWPKFSPSGDQIAYIAANPQELYVTDRTGSVHTRILTDTQYATWVDETHLIIQRSFDFYLVNLAGPQVLTPVVTYSGFDSEPVYVPALAPTINITSPTAGSLVSGSVTLSGKLGSVGVPTVDVSGTAAVVSGDTWTATLPTALPGTYTVTVTITDTATGLASQDSVTFFVNQPALISISEVNGNAELDWGHVGGNIDRYEVWRSTDPYFSPVAPTATKVTDLLPQLGWTLGTPVNYPDPGSGVGNTAVNDFYVVKVIVGPTETVSNRVGEFDFAIVPGS